MARKKVDRGKVKGKKQKISVKKSKARVKNLKKAVKAASFKEPRVDTLKPLYSYKRSKPDDNMSRKVFDKKPSEFTDADIRHLVKGVNDRLYKIEKAGLTQESKTYQTIMKYAAENDLNMYNLDLEKDIVRVTGDLSRFPDNQSKYEYIRRLQEIMSNQTSTVGGTKKAIKKAYESFLKNPKMMTMDADGKIQPIHISLEEYKKIWKAYKNNVEPDENGKYESDDVIDFMHATKFMGYNDIPDESLEAAFRYYNQEKDRYQDMYSFLIDNPNVFSDM